MSNQWSWKKVDDTEYKLMNAGIMSGWLRLAYSGEWVCHFYNDDYDMKFSATFIGMKNPEQVLWQATLWIDNTCNQVANSFHRIRDNMPSIVEMYNAYEATERRIDD